jgi:hypothetical protein
VTVVVEKAMVVAATATAGGGVVTEVGERAMEVVAMVTAARVAAQVAAGRVIVEAVTDRVAEVTATAAAVVVTVEVVRERAVTRDGPWPLRCIADRTRNGRDRFAASLPCCWLLRSC